MEGKERGVNRGLYHICITYIAGACHRIRIRRAPGSNGSPALRVVVVTYRSVYHISVSLT